MPSSVSPQNRHALGPLRPYNICRSAFPATSKCKPPASGSGPTVQNSMCNGGVADKLFKGEVPRYLSEIRIGAIDLFNAYGWADGGMWSVSRCLSKTTVVYFCVLSECVSVPLRRISLLPKSSCAGQRIIAADLASPNCTMDMAIRRAASNVPFH